MRLIIPALVAFALAVPVHAAPADDVAKLAWLAGSWIETKGGVTTREVWLAPIDGTMAGVGQTSEPGKAGFVEFGKITAEAGGATFTALLPEQPPVAFVLLPGPDGEAVFENKAHDFPQRVIYRRCGRDLLCARIEGLVKGKLRHQDWRYRRAR
jgi:hypothetical protein